MSIAHPFSWRKCMQLKTILFGISIDATKIVTNIVAKVFLDFSFEALIAAAIPYELKRFIILFMTKLLFTSWITAAPLLPALFIIVTFRFDKSWGAFRYLGVKLCLKVALLGFTFSMSISLDAKPLNRSIV